MPKLLNGMYLQFIWGIPEQNRKKRRKSILEKPDCSCLVITNSGKISRGDRPKRAHSQPAEAINKSSDFRPRIRSLLGGGSAGTSACRFAASKYGLFPKMGVLGFFIRGYSLKGKFEM